MPWSRKDQEYIDALDQLVLQRRREGMGLTMIARRLGVGLHVVTGILNRLESNGEGTGETTKRRKRKVEGRGNG